MKTVFEMVSQEALPLVRAMTSQHLLASGLSQKQVADRLGLTQPAISQYKNQIRGKANVLSAHPQLLTRLKELSTKIAAGELTMNQATSEIFQACLLVKPASL